MKEGIANVTDEQTNSKKEKFNKTILMNSILSYTNFYNEQFLIRPIKYDVTSIYGRVITDQSRPKLNLLNFQCKFPTTNQSSAVLVM